MIGASGTSAGQASQTVPVLDLTATVSPNEQGYYHGIPGSSGGGATDGWRPGPGDTVRYTLPLSMEIGAVTQTKDGDFVFELLLRNTESVPFDLPSSSKLTTIEKPENKARRLFFLQLRLVNGNKADVSTLASATTAGSTSIPGSFIQLNPDKSLRVLLLVSSDLIRHSFKQAPEKLAVKAVCNEWRLDDNRFFLSGMSADLNSKNAVQFQLHGGQILPLEAQR